MTRVTRSGRVHRAKVTPRQMEDFSEIGREVGDDDIKSSEKLKGATEDEGGNIDGKLAAGKAGRLAS